MRRALVPAVVALCVSASHAAAQRSLTIDRFDATIVVEPDGGIQVTERITATFTGAWNGLYRSIPIKYRTPHGFNWSLGLDILDATDGDGRALEIEQSREGPYRKLKIWVPGAQDATHTVVLQYHATNALRFFDEHDELYWNVTGDEWDVPIQAASAVIELPAGATGVRATAFNGVYGATAQDAEVETRGTTVRIVMPQALGFHEGLTAVVGWNKGVVVEPTAVERVAGTLANNWPLAIPIPVFLAMLFLWRRSGRDPERLPVTVRYEPPEGLTPAEAGTLIDNSPDMKDITATLVDLAVRGHVRFEERIDRKLFGLIRDREYVMHRLQPAETDTSLAPHERLVLNGVFSGRGDFVELSELEDEFYTAIPGITNSVFDGLLERGYYRARPDRVRTRWIVGGALLGVVVAFGGSAIAARFLLTPVPFVIAGVAAAIIVIAFAFVMPARTVAGARALEHVLGFEEFQRRVASEELQRVIVGHPELFDRYLPYAMAFGLEKKWAKAFEGIYTEAPRWYSGPSTSDFSVSRLSSSLDGFTSSAGSTMSSAPRSSSGSGFGGGGSSGGGGGGGGGGGF